MSGLVIALRAFQASRPDQPTLEEISVLPMAWRHNRESRVNACGEARGEPPRGSGKDYGFGR